MLEDLTPPALRARQWHASLDAPAMATGAGRRVYLSRYSGTRAEMTQPALADHILCLHMGGDKRVSRYRDGGETHHSVRDHTLTIMPARQPNRWVTHGPIDFAHLAIDPDLLDRVALEEFDLLPGAWRLSDPVGVQDPEMVRMFVELLRAAARPSEAERLYPEGLLVVLAATLIGRYADMPALSDVHRRPLRGGLANWRLRRVLDFMASNMAADIGLEELTAVSGLSRAQFFRAFRQSTGSSPHKYLSQMRLDQAGALLRDTKLTLPEVALAVGMKPGGRFSAAIRRQFNIGRRDLS